MHLEFPAQCLTLPILNPLATVGLSIDSLASWSLPAAGCSCLYRSAVRCKTFFYCQLQSFCLDHEWCLSESVFGLCGLLQVRTDIDLESSD
jgi:hypothetical protein